MVVILVCCQCKNVKQHRVPQTEMDCSSAQLSADTFRIRITVDHVYWPQANVMVGAGSCRRWRAVQAAVPGPQHGPGNGWAVSPGGADPLVAAWLLWAPHALRAGHLGHSLRRGYLGRPRTQAGTCLSHS